MRWLTLAVLIATATPAIAKSPDILTETKGLLSGCQALIENDPSGNTMQMGACAGAVSASLAISRSLKRACPSPGIDVVEAARVVIRFANESASHRAEPFGVLALSAFGSRWPC